MLLFLSTFIGLGIVSYSKGQTLCENVTTAINNDRTCRGFMHTVISDSDTRDIERGCQSSSCLTNMISMYLYARECNTTEQVR